jgi:hypothetical protein
MANPSPETDVNPDFLNVWAAELDDGTDADFAHATLWSKDARYASCDTPHTLAAVPTLADCQLWAVFQTEAETMICRWFAPSLVVFRRAELDSELDFR